MLFVSPCRYLCPIHWSQVLSREWRWRCSTCRRCSNYFWVINSFIAYKGAVWIRYLTVIYNVRPLGYLFQYERINCNMYIHKYVEISTYVRVIYCSIDKILYFIHVAYLFLYYSSLSGEAAGRARRRRSVLQNFDIYFIKHQKGRLKIHYITVVL